MDRFTPAPEPPLKISPSSRYQLRIDSSESCTDSRKHAEGVCGTPGTPTLNQTGLLNANFWETIRFARSSANSSARFSESKYPCLNPSVVYLMTIRSIRCFRDVSSPRKYLVTTIVSALADQDAGNSTPLAECSTSPVRWLTCSKSCLRHS